MKLEVILSKVADKELVTQNFHKRLLTLMRINHGNIPVMSQINEHLTGYEILGLITAIEDKELKQEILNKTYTIREQDLHENAKWKLTILSFIFTVILIVYFLLVLTGNGTIAEDLLELIKKLLLLIIDWLTESDQSVVLNS